MSIKQFVDRYLSESREDEDSSCDHDWENWQGQLGSCKKCGTYNPNQAPKKESQMREDYDAVECPGGCGRTGPYQNGQCAECGMKTASDMFRKNQEKNRKQRDG
jgi:hypothetical protein